ncbi:hypothetical protein AURDEDRAFT_165280 [Auricularia subglabra TFB-10046 SS5]|nr:hypothetical protein AURDEDRAFT_165280 [Auricularia subglabra TFB-10046 SS5]
MSPAFERVRRPFQRQGDLDRRFPISLDIPELPPFGIPWVDHHQRPRVLADPDTADQNLNAEDEDYKTAYSYFSETFENMSSHDDPQALNSLKYMLLCKIMLNLALRDHRDELSSDPTIRSHLAALYHTLLEQNLLRIVEPYSVVEVAFDAQSVAQDRQRVAAKLSQMILDMGLPRCAGPGPGDVPYESAIQMLEQVGKVVELMRAL